MFLHYYTKLLLVGVKENATQSGWLSVALRALLIRFGGQRNERRINALEHHCGNYPARDGTGFLGYIDSVSAVGSEAAELRGWLLHESAPIVALTFFGNQGAAMGDYGFPRPDLIELFPQFPQVGLCGFRVIMPLGSFPREGRLTFQAFLADQATRFGSFPLVQLNELRQTGEFAPVAG